MQNLITNITKSDLLIEFLTEELPPLNLERNIGYTFADSLRKELGNFTSGDSTYEVFVTPRRFGCILHNVLSNEPTQQVLRKGPARANAFKNDEPGPALIGFAKSCGAANIADLELRDDGYFYYLQTKVGNSLTQALPEAINTALKKLPIAKTMRWASNTYQFVRPVHNLVILYGNRVICPESNIMGLSPVNYTFGHRIMSNGPINLTTPAHYKEALRNAGHVIASFSERKEMIAHALQAKATNLNLQIGNLDDLLDEVTAIVEYPVVLNGQFAKEFLNVPQECLILSMAKNQKYFALLDMHGKLSNQFLFVANIASTNPSVIIAGNEKVLSARLADAQFFYNLDLQQPLEHFTQQLNNVVYHNKLGSQYERIERIAQISADIGTSNTHINVDKVRRCAHLLKADLMTNMVGEFPELQGTMGKYYALHQGEDLDIATAIETHYQPRFSGDNLPKGDMSIIMALSDKLETLVGIWGIGLAPTSDKDPFALRRAALGVARILLEHDFDLKQLLDVTYATFKEANLNPSTTDDLYQFILGRLSNYLSTTHMPAYSIECVRSVMRTNPSHFTHILPLLDTLSKFATNPDNQSLLVANKRIENILNKNKSLDLLNIQQSLLEDQSEIKLYELLNRADVQNLCNINLNRENASKTLNAYFNQTLLPFKKPIDDFFTNVMVMSDNIDVRNNRLALLSKLHGVFNHYSILSELS